MLADIRWRPSMPVVAEDYPYSPLMHTILESQGRLASLDPAYREDPEWLSWQYAGLIRKAPQALLQEILQQDDPRSRTQQILAAVGRGDSPWAADKYLPSI